MNQALYAHMNNKRKMKKKSLIFLHSSLPSPTTFKKSLPKATTDHRLLPSKGKVTEPSTKPPRDRN
jgi:hypothetical protein